MTYENLKALFWPHVAAPFAVLVILDYIVLAAAFVKVFAAAWLMLQLLAFLVGFVAAGVTKFSPYTPLAGLNAYRLADYFPLLDAGYRAFAFLMEDAADD